MITEKKISQLEQVCNAAAGSIFAFNVGDVRALLQSYRAIEKELFAAAQTSPVTVVKEVVKHVHIPADEEKIESYKAEIEDMKEEIGDLEAICRKTMMDECNARAALFSVVDSWIVHDFTKEEITKEVFKKKMSDARELLFGNGK